MQVFDDPYKSAGNVEFRIHNVSQFVRFGPAGRSLRASDSVYVRGFAWKILAIAHQKQNGPQIGQKYFGYGLMCNIGEGNTGPDWSCACSAMLKLVAQKEGKADHSGTICHDFKANEPIARKVGEIPLEDLMNPENGYYDAASDSIILQANITANPPDGVKNMPDNVYLDFKMRSEHALFVELKDGIGVGTNTNQYNTSNLAVEDKLWSFSYAHQTLSLEMSMHSSDKGTTTAECIFWYWGDKDIAILKKIVHTFGEEANVYNADSQKKISKFCVFTAGIVPVNKKFNVVIRLLDDFTEDDRSSFDSYYGDYEGVDMVTLCIDGIDGGSFDVPKYALMCASPVFERMFANEMTERTTDTIENIKDANPEEFCDFLRAISPKQQHPNPSNVFALLKLAHRFQCQSLLDRCELHLINCIEIPIIHRLSCANVYGLIKLKNSLMVSFEGTGLFKLFQQAEPYLGILNEFAKKIE